MRIAMISYNTFAKGECNGWKENGDNHVLLLQNENGSKWGRTQVITGYQTQAQAEAQWNAEAVVTIDPLWEQLKRELPTIDKVVIYVGSTGAERVIGLAAAGGLTPDRAIFVFCDCNKSRKMAVLHDYGFTSSKVIDCECGGHYAMFSIFHNALLKGTLPN